MSVLAQSADAARVSANRLLDPGRKLDLGQFMTPAPVAEFMASLFEFRQTQEMRLLDAGAGVGSLTAAVIDRWMNQVPNKCTARSTAYEIENVVLPALRRTLEESRNRVSEKSLFLETTIQETDFIEAAVRDIMTDRGDRYTHVILNPPYRKINSGSRHRLLLRKVGLETVNLYPAFVALALMLMVEGGELVAIIPRSFCNGLYYKPFRKWLFAHAVLTHIHLFESRTEAFKDDNVLQENVIVRLIRGRGQREVEVSISRDKRMANRAVADYPFSQIVHPGDESFYIHIPTGRNASDATGGGLPFGCSLADLGLELSTGPVVDFRLGDQLCQHPEPGAVPLLYPVHFSRGRFEYPKEGRKPNAIRKNAETEKWLLPNGFYVLVKRFTSKEEKRRIVAYVLDPKAFPSADRVGIENHLNVFHACKAGIPADLAHGLALFLNSTAVDGWFRQFSGHTQVNATDLRRMKYPDLETLNAMGREARKQGYLEQDQIDRMVGKHVKAG